MTSLRDAVALARDESGLAVVSTVRADLTIQASLINAGALPHPASGDLVLAYVTYGRVKLANLRARPQTAVTFRNGWQWATVEGRAELAGPDDPQPCWTPRRCSRSCFVTSSPPQAAPTTTGPPTTRRCASSDALPCW